MNVLHVGRRMYVHIEDPDAPFRPLCGKTISQSDLVVTRSRNLPDDTPVKCRHCATLASAPTKNVYRRVVDYTWYNAKSLARLSTSRWWELTLECGHVERRRFRYRDEPAELGSAYGFDQALPPPNRVICKQCSKKEQDGHSPGITE